MIRLYPEQLAAQLREQLRPVYLLLGNDPLLLQESQDSIRAQAQLSGFEEHHTVEIDSHTDWQGLFNQCQALSLFSARQTLLLLLPDNGPNAAINTQLETVVKLLHPDILLIIRGNKFTKAQENASWYKQIIDNCVLVSCQTPEHAQLPRWVAKRAQQLKLSLDDAANQLLCYCYEGNLLALAQALERLSLIWPDGKLTLPRVEQAVSDAAHFSPFHWVDALLAGKSKRALHILRQLRLEASEPVILLRTLQRELMLLLNIKRQMNQAPLRNLLDQHRVWQNRRALVGEAANRISLIQISQAIHLLAQAELKLKKDFAQSIWQELEEICIVISHQPLPEIYTRAI